MPITNFIDGPQRVLIETTETSGASTPVGPAFTRSLQAISQEVAKAMSQVSDKSKPSELVVSFRMRHAAEGFVITAAEGDGNFAVQMKFSASNAADLTDVVPRTGA